MPSSSTMSGVKQVPAGDVDERFAPVHAELAAIFKGLAGTRGQSTAAFASGPLRRSGYLTMGLIGALLLLGIGVFAFSRPTRSPPVKAVAPARQDAAPISSPAALPQASAPAAVAKPSEIKADLPRVVVAPVAPVEAVTHISRANPHAIVAGKINKASTTRGRTLLVSAPRASRQPQSPRPVETVMDCAPAFEAWCLREATSAADRNLRNAYGTAVQAGVDRATLKGINREWDRYRSKAKREPRELIRGYAALAMDLRHLASRQDGVKAAERPR